MTHDELERRLRTEPLTHDSGFEARPLPASAADARASIAPRPAPGRLLLMVAAVAAVAMVSVGVLAGTGNLGVGGPGPAASVPVASPASQAPGIAEGACVAGDLVAASEAWGAAAGSRGTVVTVSLAPSAAECDLVQHVSARILDGSGSVVASVFQLDPGSGDAGSEAPVRVTRASAFTIGVSWSNWCGTAPAGPLTLELAIGGTDWTAIAPPSGTSVLVPPCMGGTITTMSVTAIQPAP